MYESVFDCKIHLDRQECIVHSCRSNFRIQVMNAEECLILGDSVTACLPEWDMQTDKSAQYTLVGQTSAFKLSMRNIVPFWETCRGNVSQNETLRPTGVHNTLLSVKLPRSSYQCGTLFHSGRHAEAMSPEMIPSYQHQFIPSFHCHTIQYFYQS